MLYSFAYSLFKFIVIDSAKYLRKKVIISFSPKYLWIIPTPHIMSMTYKLK